MDIGLASNIEMEIEVDDIKRRHIFPTMNLQVESRPMVDKLFYPWKLGDTIKICNNGLAFYLQFLICKHLL